MITTLPQPKQGNYRTTWPADDRKHIVLLVCFWVKYIPSTEAFTKGTTVTIDTYYRSCDSWQVSRIAQVPHRLGEGAFVGSLSLVQGNKSHVPCSTVWNLNRRTSILIQHRNRAKLDYFSIQAEIILQNQQQEWVMVKIQQSPRQKEQSRSHSLNSLLLPQKAVKNFELAGSTKRKQLRDSIWERIAYLGKSSMKKDPPKPGLCMPQEPDIAQAYYCLKEPLCSKEAAVCSSSAKTVATVSARSSYWLAKSIRFKLNL